MWSATLLVREDHRLYPVAQVEFGEIPSDDRVAGMLRVP